MGRECVLKYWQNPFVADLWQFSNSCSEVPLCSKQIQWQNANAYHMARRISPTRRTSHTQISACWCNQVINAKIDIDQGIRMKRDKTPVRWDAALWWELRVSKYGLPHNKQLWGLRLVLEATDLVASLLVCFGVSRHLALGEGEIEIHSRTREKRN